MNDIRKRNLHNAPVIAIFFAFLFAVLAAFVFTPSYEYNMAEQRALAQRPNIAEAKSLDDFASGWESYVSDQFPGRNRIEAGVKEAEFAGTDDRLIDDVYVLSDDYLFSYTYPVDNWKYGALMSQITASSDQSGLPFVYIIVPQKNIVLEDAEKSIDAKYNAENLHMLENDLLYWKLPYINTCPKLLSYSLEQRSKFYFKTDFHWNELGAYTACEYIAEQLADMGYIKKSSVPKDDDFIWTNYTGRDYLGDLQRRFSQEVTVKEYIPVYEAVNKDELIYYTNYRGSAVSRDTIVGTGLKSDGVLNYNTMSTYNLGYLRIENPNAPEIKSVLLIKDSYACTTLEYLSQIFTELNVVDPRYTDMNLKTLLKARDVDLVLLMFHESNVSSELIQYLKP